MKSKSLGLDPLYWQVVDFVINEDSVSELVLQRMFSITPERVERLMLELEKTGVVSNGTPRVVYGFPYRLEWREVSADPHNCNISTDKYTNVLKLDKGKSVIYQDSYNRGFSGKPEFIIDIHSDIGSYDSIETGSVDERLKHVYLSTYWSRETIVAFHYDSELRTLFIDVDLPEIEDTPVSNGERLKTAEEYYYDYARHVHSVALRVAGVAFRVCNEIDFVIVAGYSQIFNHDTGEEEDRYLINVKLNRYRFEWLPIKNISQCDPIQFLSGFDAIVSMANNYKMNMINLRW
ncbi:DNA translocase FtsK [Providencia sp.]|uniref:DNA translocase FtsK n=1 Tax=Providencia sp. TaxID=589 RepID=UPI003F9B6476